MTDISPILAGKMEWELETSPYPLPHKLASGEVIMESFRRYRDAIALLDWENYCVIEKIETLKPRTGAATSLITFLKTLALKHRFRIFGNPIPYKPTCLLAAASPLSQTDLQSWYSKNGFLVGNGNDGGIYLWFPNKPESQSASGRQ
ncbi:MAG: hypothetical protein HOP33_07390 [Verrucomicrobia bacterium]|nr:hypothetical protein [Verrucomicrobiota bacterium]